MGASGAKVKGRYSFIYVYEDDEWKINHHHSSVMPEASKPQPITEEEVRGLFQLWNSALATEDPDAVAKRYANKAVLLPTVSDVPRTDYALIKDYFVGFLKKKPQGTILESNVTMGDNWCQVCVSFCLLLLLYDVLADNITTESCSASAFITHFIIQHYHLTHNTSTFYLSSSHIIGCRHLRIHNGCHR